MSTRRTLLGSAALSVLTLGLALVGAGCGGPGTRLVTVRVGSGQGAVELEVKNMTDVPINSFFLAKTSDVGPQLDPESPDGQKVWGGDLISATIATGTRTRVPVSEAGRWDARAVDRDGRYQHIAGLKLDAGGKYILELQESGWRVQ